MAQKRYYTEGHLRRILKFKCSGKTQIERAKEIGVTAPFLSQVLGGAPLTGKIVQWLGYRKTRERLFERLE